MEAAGLTALTFWTRRRVVGVRDNFIFIILEVPSSTVNPPKEVSLTTIASVIHNQQTDWFRSLARTTTAAAFTFSLRKKIVVDLP